MRASLFHRQQVLGQKPRRGLGRRQLGPEPRQPVRLVRKHLRPHVVTARPPQISLVNANGAGDVMAARLFCDLESQPDMALSDRLRAALAAGADYAAGAMVEA